MPSVKRIFTIFFVFMFLMIFMGVVFVFLKEPFLNIILKPQIILFSPQPTSPNNTSGYEDLINKPLPNPPQIIKAVYLTGWSAGNKNYINYLINLIKTTEINSVVVDIKDYTGNISYKTDLPQFEKALGSVKINNIDSLINELHEKGIYVIARITVFQDSILAENRPDLAIHQKSKPSLWRDKSGLAWLDPASIEVWDYILALSKDALKHGFDELNYDYVRFPSDGSLNSMEFPFWNEITPRNIVIRNFFEYLRQNLPNKKLSVDLFGLATVESEDLGIGQIIEDAYGYFDYVCPMVYPSHYAQGFIGYQNPAAYPYEVILYSLQNAKNRLQFYQQITGAEKQKTLAKIRPWIQDFNLKQDTEAGISYSTEMVKLEIKAIYDSLGEDFSGFMIWSPSNVYTKEAFSPNE